ncbi:hypothetical protein LCGC14_1518160 [marine sediment metagenome]|uniref:OmpA-like domain-containing protein n=1 Tax=marine sediment metagenome TaxID=412755 RepID=A0A0F9M0L9_9ZZZZ
MIGSRRRSRSTTNVWPGYVDALSALLMLVIFMLLVYVVSQLFLSQTLSDRNSELAQLNQRLNEISQLLGLEKNKTDALEQQILTVQSNFSDSLAQNEGLQERLDASRNRLMQQTADAEARAERLANMNQELDSKDELSSSQQNMILRLSNQIASLQNQLRQITKALNLQKEMTANKDGELEDVSRRLNTLLAERVNELEQYQSEFFSRLRNILAANENIRIVGDGPRRYAVWLDHWPVFLDGLDGLPRIGDRFEIDGESLVQQTCVQGESNGGFGLVETGHRDVLLFVKIVEEFPVLRDKFSGGGL